MSELDMDIRAVSSASYGARVTDSDNNPVQTQDQSSLVNPTADNQSANPTTDSAYANGQTNNTSGPSSVASTTTSRSKAAVQPSFRYDSFRFIYRTDYGRIVLVNQNPETGMQIAQIPSQRALQIYAEQTRTEGRVASTATGGSKVQAGTGTRPGPHSHGSPQPGTGTGLGRTASVGTGATTVSAAPHALPVSSAVFVAPTQLPVNITI
jgi:hypothetical protein